MGQDITVRCRCGAFEAIIHDASPKNGNHAMCYCRDCQAFARHLGCAGSVTDEAGGTELYQTQPFQVDIKTGAENLAVLQLAKKGLYRWHSSCCGTPLCNTLGTPKFSFASFLVSNMEDPGDAIGPIIYRHKIEQAIAEVDAPKGSLARFAFRTMRNALVSRVNGKWQETPFFKPYGKSVVKPYVLSETERNAAYTS